MIKACRYLISNIGFKNVTLISLWSERDGVVKFSIQMRAEVAGQLTIQKA